MLQSKFLILVKKGDPDFFRLSNLTRIIQLHIAEKTKIKAHKYVSAYLVNPPKLAVVDTLGLPLPKGTSEVDLKSAHQILKARRAECHIIDVIEGRAYEVICDLSTAEIVDFKLLSEGLQPSLHPEELGEAENALRKNSEVVSLARQVGVEPENLYADGWSIGYDDRFPLGQRIQQCLLYARKDEHENLYAHPMDFSVVLDLNTHEVLSIDFGPVRSADGNDTIDGRPPSSMDITAQKALFNSNRERVKPPMESYDYLPELMAQDPKMPALREDLKPLNIVQPDGVSYQLRGNEVSWQKWNFHVGYHPRDGLVISTVTYKDGNDIRPLFYRLSVAEMVVPYAETSFPHARKFAFDVGEYGMGTLANSLKIGCDCLGTISYLDGCFIGLDGKPTTIEQCICIHEEDAGLAFKHTDYRPGGQNHSVRNRKLVIQMLCTIANYEYIFNYNFYADGNIEVQVRLTGILNLALKAPGDEESNPYGIEVAPSVNAQLHQHVFSLRVDPMIDGHENSVIQSDVVASPSSTGSEGNYLGNGFLLDKKVLNETGSYDWKAEAHRTWTIANSKKKHYASGLPASYRIHTRDYETLATRPDSMVSKRAQFATKALWITRHDENQLWPAGKYVAQQRGTSNDSISRWIEPKDNTEDEDIVVWVTFGVTHIPRPEE